MGAFETVAVIKKGDSSFDITTDGDVILMAVNAGKDQAVITMTVDYALDVSIALQKAAVVSMIITNQGAKR